MFTAADIIRRAEAERDALLQRVDRAQHELAARRAELDQAEAALVFLRRFADEKVAAPRDGSPNADQRVDGTTYRETIADGFRARGGKARLSDVIDDLKRAGKARGQNPYNYAWTVVNRGQKDRYVKHAAGVYELIEPTVRSVEGGPNGRSRDVPLRLTATQMSMVKGGQDEH